MGMNWLFKQWTFALKMGLSFLCILLLGFGLTLPQGAVHSNSKNKNAPLIPNSEAPAFYVSIQPIFLPADYANLPDCPQKKTLGILIFKYGHGLDWIHWFKSMHHQQRLPSPKVFESLTKDSNLVASAPFLPIHLRSLKPIPQNWFSALPSLHFHSNNLFHRYAFGDSKQNQGLISGHFGYSLRNHLPVKPLILNAAKSTLRFAFPAFILSCMVGLVLGLVSTYLRFPVLPMFLISIIPSYVLGAFVFLAFDWGGSTLPPTVENENIVQIIKAYSLPILTLVLVHSSLLSAHIHFWMQEETKHDYYRTALAKGLRPLHALFVHALRAILPLILTFFLQRFPLILSGTVVVEVMFEVPGFGRLAWVAVSENDQPIVLGCMLLASVLAWITVFLNGLFQSNPRNEL